MFTLHYFSPIVVASDLLGVITLGNMFDLTKSLSLSNAGIGKVQGRWDLLLSLNLKPRFPLAWFSFVSCHCRCC